MKRLATILAACIVVTATVRARADEVRLDPASIHDLFPGYYRAEVYGGYTLLIAARANGRLDGKAFGRMDKGKWRIVGDRLCVVWQHWTNGATQCGRIVSADGWYVAYAKDQSELLRFKAIRADSFGSNVATASAVDRN